MDTDFWYKQTAEHPLFPELLWSQPENSRFAGKLLIVGGSKHSFALPALAYTESGKAGIGVRRVILPDSLQKTVTPLLNEGEYAHGTPSGSFGLKSLAVLLDSAHWADAVLLAGNFGRNSETAVLIERFLQKYTGWTVITKDAVEDLVAAPEPIMDRPRTALVVNLSQLQRLGTACRLPQAITFSMGLVQLVAWLHNFTQQFPLLIVVKYADTLCAAHDGKVNTTKSQEDMPLWRIKTASHLATWLAQNPSKPFQAATCAVLHETQ